MLSRADLKRIATERLVDAEILLKADRYDGATYLCGYVVEIMLKLRICKTLRWDGFPETRREFDGLASFKTHNFDDLLHLSGVEEKIKRFHLSEWSTVKAWNPELRYSRVVSLNKKQAARRREEVSDMIRATKLLMSLL